MPETNHFNLSGLKVCFIAGTLGQGGAERQLFYMLKVLRQRGAIVRLLSLSQGEFWEEPIRQLGVSVIWVGQSESKTARLQRIVHELRQDKPEIIQSQHFYTNLYATAAARLLGRREIGAIRSGGYGEVIENGRVLGPLSLRLPRMIAANSRAAIEHAILQGVPRERLYFLPNAIDCDLFDASSQYKNGENRNIQLLMAGRLAQQKRVDRMLRIAARLREHSPTAFHLTIAGDGPLRTELERQAADLQLSPEIVEFRGVLKEMAPVYKASDIFVLTSDYEGTPNVVMEAMASGLPVVTTNFGGTAEIAKHNQSAYMVAPEDEDGFLHFLLELINRPSERARLGEGARKYIENNHSLNQLSSHLSGLYQKVLA